MTDVTITCPHCKGPIPVNMQIVEPKFEQESFSSSMNDPTPFLMKEGVNVTSLEISPQIVRTKHPLDKHEWKHNNSILKRIGFMWHSEGELSRWQR